MQILLVGGGPGRGSGTGEGGTPSGLNGEHQQAAGGFFAAATQGGTSKGVDGRAQLLEGGEGGRDLHPGGGAGG